MCDDGEDVAVEMREKCDFNIDLFGFALIANIANKYIAKPREMRSHKAATASHKSRKENMT